MPSSAPAATRRPAPTAAIRSWPRSRRCPGWSPTSAARSTRCAGPAAVAGRPGGGRGGPDHLRQLAAPARHRGTGCHRARPARRACLNDHGDLALPWAGSPWPSPPLPGLSALPRRDLDLGAVMALARSRSQGEVMCPRPGGPDGGWGLGAEQDGYRLYQDLAAGWALISPPEEYAEEAAFAGRLLRQADRPVRAVLELGSGGGHCASHLAPGFTMTLVDLSAGMLAVSRRLNPGCEHVEADMRTARLGRDFDAVFVHDAVDYMTTEDDLRQVIETAFLHCRPGGVAVFVPDNIAENFEPGTGYGGIDGADGRGARYLDWSYDQSR